MKPEELADAVFEDTPTVLRRKLRPLTIGHALLLVKLGHPALAGDARRSPGDLLLGVALCSRGFDQARALVVHTRRLQLALAWLSVRSKLVGMDQAAWDWDEAQFIRYVHRSFTAPRTWSKNGGSPAGSPLLGAVMVTLQKLGMGVAEVLQTPLRLGLAEYCMYWESEGELSLQSDEDDEMVARARELGLAEARRREEESRRRGDAETGRQGDAETGSGETRNGETRNGEEQAGAV